MPYFWIFLGCYVVAFTIINIKMTAQTANTKARLKQFGASAEKFDANRRALVSLPKEMLIRLWAPFVFSIFPTGLLSLGYFFFS